ncbi:MAG: hypothetical protein KGM42_02195 [Hyphomicrobiales bacterium]|nr:hypothetical protein [Hyphomicrobiales bacterium]
MSPAKSQVDDARAGGLGRLAGFTLLGFAWALLAGMLVLRALGGRPDLIDAELAMCVVLVLCVSGATLIVGNVMTVGFGALDAFFNQALERSARRASQAAQAPSAHTAAPAPAPARTDQKKSLHDAVVEQGYLGDRPFTLFGDGAVSVETLLGTRRFASFHEAEEFIGA